MIQIQKRGVWGQPERGEGAATMAHKEQFAYIPWDNPLRRVAINNITSSSAGAIYAFDVQGHGFSGLQVCEMVQLPLTSTTVQ